MIPGTITALTFDCYGTLIDWETGILRAFERLIGGGLAPEHRDDLIRSYARIEREIEAGPYLPYRDVLALAASRIAGEFGVSLRPGEQHALAESVGDWPAFRETPPMLRALKRKYRLAVLSNIDDDLFALSRPHLGVDLDEVVTAQQVRSYKPGRAHFDEALRRLALEPGALLHVAESRYHDIAPARSLGIATVWVNRRPGGGPSASGESAAIPDREVRSLGELVEWLAPPG
ncbi:MAG: haloacid dehalogenase type II [Phycisphaerae bacterium]|nr:haloacid dehalogenase type II [Phycisphaerae bacterium]